MTQVIVLNGGSSSGKSTIARALQDVLPGMWLTFGTDVLAEALPGRGDDPRSGLVLDPDGTVTAKPEFRAVEEIWYQGLAVMASRGALLIQAYAVHSGVVYDVEVDTTDCSAVGCACRIAEVVARQLDVADFGGPAQFTTWDGEPVSREPPHGATVVVAAESPEGWRCLLLHRAHHGPSWDGDWAWTPPSGSRKPGEDVTACATRELREETGLSAIPRPVVIDEIDWAVFALRVPWGTEVALDGDEHDRFEWVTVAEALRRCRPDALAGSFLTACEAMGLH